MSRRDPGASVAASLRGAFLEVFLLASRLYAGDGQHADPAVLRGQALQSIESERARLLGLRVPERVIHEAQLALYFLLDEAAMTDRIFGAGWSPLQPGELRGGEEFFRRLDVLRQNLREPVELLEIYARCVFFGFKGMYAPQRLQDLQILKETLRRELESRSGAPPLLAPDLRAPSPPPPQWPLLPWPFVPAVAVALLGVLVVGLYLNLRGASLSTAQQVKSVAIARPAEETVR